MRIKKDLYQGRVLSIDAMRGITILVMIFVNELAGVSDVPLWMKHMPADADGMTFVDLVFPGFLFIVGMSVPFAFNARLIKGDSVWGIWKHTCQRALALIVMGVYMVNAEYGYDESRMVISASLWAFFAYSLPIPIWNKYKRNFPIVWKNTLQYGGMIGLLILYFLYVRDDGQVGLIAKWWGILGLIGWAYLFSVIVYWLVNGDVKLLTIFFLLCIGVSCTASATSISIQDQFWFEFSAIHLTHASIVSAGVIVSLLFFEKGKDVRVHWSVIGFTILLLVMGYLLRPYFGVSKIRATPSWCLYSSALCTVMYYFLYELMECKKRVAWSSFFMPAAANPLLIYILPGIIIYFNLSIGLRLTPDYFTRGVPGILWCAVFSVLMVFLMKVFNRINIRLHL
ncbi:hypothetical protein BFP72_13865 [Reichenbachiella sp. 5M10]|uniref:DUF5009 domain-containing protein n=1 Tax=Reichenbachiella sp. 5M10 TaxID=1889772 RepID=UPI000C158516|nr:DUF5009 domain-containing protein [Reichenbachiella sp. 5M10]PIB36405.1 hypothetical protein BFP72_13865 [Reichenbachiella sp. 5M10]